MSLCLPKQRFKSLNRLPNAEAPNAKSKRYVQGTFDDRMINALQGDPQAGNWEEQLKQMNMTPEDVIGKIMSEPTLAQVGPQHP